MWGYINKSQLELPRLLAYVATVGFIATILLVAASGLVSISGEVLATIIAALIGIDIAIETLFIQSKLTLRQQLNVKAIDDITEAMNDFQSAAAVTVTFSNDFVVIPLTMTPGFWYLKASDKYMKMQNDMQNIRENNKLYTAVESNEIAVIHLEQYYRYLTLEIDKFFKQADELLNNFLQETSNWNLTEEGYKSSAAKLSALHQTWTDIAAYFIDFRKLLQNELLGNVFGRKLLSRKPKPGFGTTLDKIATLKHVTQLVKERDELFNVPDPGSTTAP